MNNLSNERLKAIAGLGSPECMTFPPSHDQCAAMARELLAYREAQGNVVAVTGEDEISNMQATGLYLRAWPTDRQRNEVEGYTIPLYAAPQLPAVPDGLALVPIEPTNEMRDAWFFMEDFDSEWAAMLAAAPKPE